MFDVGFWELLLIGVITLLVVGPERLPALARKAGTYIAKLRNFISDTKGQVLDELDGDNIKKHLQLEDEGNSILDIVKDVKEQVVDINNNTLNNKDDNK